MTSKTSDTGKMERLVKMDYSVAYRQNDKLDEDLDEHLYHLKRSAERMLSEKDEELETARADVDMILKLKEVVNSRQEREGSLTILCQSADPWGRKSSRVSSATRRGVSAGSGGSARSTSVTSGVQDSVEEVDGEESTVPGYFTSSSTSHLPDVTKMSLTERRLFKEREQFSAKNLFNVRRKNSFAYTFDSTTAKRGDLSPESLRTIAAPTALPSQPSAPSPQRRPMTSPAAYGGRSAPRTRGYLRPTTASSSRLVSFSGDGLVDDGLGRPPRRPRSRRELQKLVELKVDPFEEEIPDKSESWTSNGDRQQDMLHSLQSGQVHLQARVSAFLRTLEEFNKRGRKSALDQILEAT